MNPTILLPELPDTTDPKAVKEYLAAHQKILADKQKDDYETVTGNKNERYPVGTWYTQYPSVKSNDEAVAFPESEEPANKFGGVWTEPFAGEYTFFRTTGINGQTRINGFSEDQVQGFRVITRYSVSGQGYAYPGYGQWAPTGYITLLPDGDGTNGVFRKGMNTETRNYLIKVWYRES